jgi:hypothetical protein
MGNAYYRVLQNVKDDIVGRTFSAHCKDEKCVQDFGWGN